jgi:hypothetical protein
MCICIASIDEERGRLNWTCLDEVTGMNDESIDLIVAAYQMPLSNPYHQPVNPEKFSKVTTKEEGKLEL